MSSGTNFNDLLKNNKVISDYMNGFYTKPNKERVKLGNKQTKYNKMFIEQLQKTRNQFSDLIKYVIFIEKLINKNLDLEDRKYFSYLNTIINSNVKQREFYIALIMAVKEHEIIHQAVYDAILEDCRAGKERVRHVYRIVDEIAEELGLNEMDSFLEKYYNTNLKKYVVDSFNEELSKVEELTDENRAEVFSKISDIRINNLINDMKSHGIDMDIHISESLQSSLQRTKEIREKTNEENRKERADISIGTINKLITDNNILLHKRINLETEDDTLIDDNYLSKLRFALLNYNKELWYICMSSREVLYYLCTSSANSRTESFRNTTLFDSEETAKEYADKVKKHNSYLVVEICKISVYKADSFEREMLEVSKELNYCLDKALERTSVRDLYYSVYDYKMYKDSDSINITDRIQKRYGIYEKSVSDIIKSLDLEHVNVHLTYIDTMENLLEAIDIANKNIDKLSNYIKENELDCKQAYMLRLNIIEYKNKLKKLEETLKKKGELRKNKLIFIDNDNTEYTDRVLSLLNSDKEPNMMESRIIQRCLEFKYNNNNISINNYRGHVCYIRIEKNGKYYYAKDITTSGVITGVVKEEEIGLYGFYVQINKDKVEDKFDYTNIVRAAEQYLSRHTTSKVYIVDKYFENKYFKECVEKVKRYEVRLCELISKSFLEVSIQDYKDLYLEDLEQLINFQAKVGELRHYGKEKIHLLVAVMHGDIYIYNSKRIAVARREFPSSDDVLTYNYTEPEYRHEDPYDYSEELIQEFFKATEHGLYGDSSLSAIFIVTL